MTSPVSSVWCTPLNPVRRPLTTSSAICLGMLSAFIIRAERKSAGTLTMPGATAPSRLTATRHPIRYRGYYYDEDTKFYYLNARYYCPEWRRFISPDDTGYLDSETPNGLNLYVYCNNDPVNYADPSGNSVIASLLIGFAISSLIGWGLSQMFGSQIADGIGSISGGATAISTGISLCALGPLGYYGKCCTNCRRRTNNSVWS